MTHPGWPILVLLLDGLADRGVPALGGRTPLVVAHTPTMDALAAGGTSGLVYPLGPGLVPSSERAQWRYLGYRELDFPGRAVLEARGAGVAVPSDTPVVHVGLRGVREESGTLWIEGRPRSFPDDEDQMLFDAVDGFEFDDIRFRVCPLGRGDGVVFMPGAHSAAVTDSDPFVVRAPMLAVEAIEGAEDEREARRTAAALRRFLVASYLRLSEHAVNTGRVRRGQMPMNAVVTKWSGQDVSVPPLPRRVGGPCVLISSHALYRGLADVVGAEYRHLSATDPEADLSAKLDAAEEALLAGASLVYVHTKAPDEAGHARNVQGKVDVIEALDQAMARLVEPSDVLTAVTTDHSTPAWGPGLHSGEAVPLTVRGPAVKRDAVERFDEVAAAGGALGTLRGSDLLPVLVDLAGRSRFRGARHGRRPTLAVDRDLPPLRLDEEPAEGGS